MSSFVLINANIDTIKRQIFPSNIIIRKKEKKEKKQRRDMKSVQIRILKGLENSGFPLTATRTRSS